MAGLAPTFQNGSNLKIRIDHQVHAYATGISFSEDIAVAAIGGIGSYSYDAIEPLQHAVRGSFVITQYLAPAFNSDFMAGKKPTRAGSIQSNTYTGSVSFQPKSLVSLATFDIEVFQKGATPTLDTTLYIIKDCRLTSYNMNFVPGSLVTERVSFIALEVNDAFAQTQSATNTTT